jgi:hypothetical protein
MKIELIPCSMLATVAYLHRIATLSWANVVELPSCCLLAAEHHASARRLCHQSVFFVGDGALRVADCAAPVDHSSFRSEHCLPHRTKEIDLQFHRCKGFFRRQCACERDWRNHGSRRWWLLALTLSSSIWSCATCSMQSESVSPWKTSFGDRYGCVPCRER